MAATTLAPPAQQRESRVLLMNQPLALMEPAEARALPRE